jgi:hypothetical protein
MMNIYIIYLALLTWKDAFDDAASRCYGGKPGYLAIVSSSGENSFLQSLVKDIPDYRSGAGAWIGGTDTSDEVCVMCMCVCVFDYYFSHI